MKMKKVISLCVCAMMALSTVANAAYETDSKGITWTDTIALESVQARVPSAKVDVIKIDAATAEKNGMVIIEGLIDDTTNDFYQIDLTVSNLGDLMSAYITGTTIIEKKRMEVRLYNAKVELNGVDAKMIVVPGTTVFDGTEWQTSPEGNADKLFSMYWNSGTEKKMYPAAAPKGIYLKNVSMDKATFYIGVEKDAKFENITPKVQITYNVFNANEDINKAVDATGTANNVSIPAAPAATLDRVVITGDTTGLKMGDKESTTLTATAYNDDGTVNEAAAITWSVDGDAVRVENGVVTALKAGTATVTATAKDGDITKTASVEITVAPADPIVVTPSINVIGPDGEPVADITAAPGTAVTGSVDGKQVKGFVWPLVKLINFDSTGIYRATFTADDHDTFDRVFDFTGIEVGGDTDVQFAIVLNTNKTGVKLNMQYVAPSAE